MFIHGTSINEYYQNKYEPIKCYIHEHNPVETEHSQKWITHNGVCILSTLLLSLCLQKQHREKRTCVCGKFFYLSEIYMYVIYIHVRNISANVSNHK